MTEQSATVQEPWSAAAPGRKLELTLFGGMRVRAPHGSPLVLPTRKAALLLAFLAANAGHPQSRETLANLLWSERAEPQARASLRQALCSLRKALAEAGSCPIRPMGGGIVLDPALAEIDLHAFREAVAAGTPAALKSAAATCSGELLQDIVAPDGTFQDWLDRERRHLCEQRIALLERLLDLHFEAGDAAAAISTARRLLDLDPLREASQRRLMEAYARDGQRTAALREYRRSREILRAELGVDPEPETEFLYRRLGKPTPEAAPAAAPSPATARHGPVTDRPAVAVLPFTDMSDLPERDYFSDGLTEDIITTLAYWRWFPVIAANSTFAYKGRPTNAGEVGRELGARYILEGSVRRDAARVRVASRLVDADTGHQLWAGRFDCCIGDVFLLQDEISARIAATVEPELDRAEQRRALRKRPENLDAWDVTLRALAEQNRFTQDGHRNAKRLLVEARALDPRAGYASSILALCHYHEAILGWAPSARGAFRESFRAALDAVELDPADWLAHAMEGIGHLWNHRDHDRALVCLDRAVELNPSAALAHHFRGCCLEFAGRPAEGLIALEAALRLDPRYRFAGTALADLALGHMLLGDAESSLAHAERALLVQPGHVRARQRQVAALGHLGRTKEASSAFAALRHSQPGFGMRYLHNTYPFRDERNLRILLDGLSAAGWEVGRA